MRTIIETTLTVMFIIISSISLIQSGIFSSYYYSSVFPTATTVYAFQKKTTNTSTSTISDKKGIVMYDYGGKMGKVYNH